MCHLEHNFFCSHYKSAMIACKGELQCRIQGTPPELIRYKLLFKVCESAHCSMSMYWKADNGKINCAIWVLNTDCDKSYQDPEDPYSGNKKDDRDMDEIVIREKAVRAVRWMEARYPKLLAQIRQQVLAGWIQGKQLSSGQLLTKVVTEEEQECWELVERDVYELNQREWQLQQLQLQAQVQAQQYAYQHQYPNHHQIQYHPDQDQPQTGYHPYQATLPSSSSGHYLPAPDSTLYLTESGDCGGHDGHAGVSDVPDVAGLLTAPPSAGEAPRSKNSSRSRSKGASKQGKTEKKMEREKEDKARTAGKEKRRR